MLVMVAILSFELSRDTQHTGGGTCSLRQKMQVQHVCVSCQKEEDFLLTRSSPPI